MEDKIKGLKKNNLPSEWIKKGKNLLDSKKYREALICFNKAIEIDGSCEEAKRYRELCLREMYSTYIETFSQKENIYL
ncbi:MAG: hypothetical protein ACE5K4_00565 [Candidatus Hydrothermarchaeota archaeon]